AARQRGVALVLVLWVLVLLSIATGTYALMVRMDRLEANALLAGTQARLSAEAGVNLVSVA
ncbi:MAG: general secretion pathway protein GspK, partial [Xanthomonadales bacterium]|nr:general secretion pathway protein GspK [Hydrogenophaga sp.]NIM71194.1 general secretion pathway protein GspK [Xanthomonadales bacterium]NIO13612.1 general secretion pathway protein GspK [Xanthomonadales bacterium]NIO51894.1 general secretion pathway protein GspK [Hydrogenophaga sp.]NIO90113.1 general secretion pathway protein GspK [Hydrogenophaga sp.]